MSANPNQPIYLHEHGLKDGPLGNSHGYHITTSPDRDDEDPATRMLVWEQITEEEGRRMAACWNACQNIETETLEGHALGVIASDYSQRLQAAIRESEELAGLLKESRANDRAAMGWLADCRAAVGDNGKRMLPEFVEHLKTLVQQRDKLLTLIESMNHMGGDERGGYCICPLNDGSAPDHLHATVCAEARRAIAGIRGPWCCEKGQAQGKQVCDECAEISAGYQAAMRTPPDSPQPVSLWNAPVGTLAPAIGGGRWYKTERGWKWNGPDGSGGTFPRPGGDWNGKLILPEPPKEAPAFRCRTEGCAFQDCIGEPCTSCDGQNNFMPWGEDGDAAVCVSQNAESETQTGLSITDETQPRCTCHRCIREKNLTLGGWPLNMVQMILCPECGNKRCPKASDHRLCCTGSNEPGQPGSIY